MDPTANARFDRVDQLTKVREGLLPGEEVYAVYDGKGIGTGFIGLTTSVSCSRTTPSATARPLSRAFRTGRSRVSLSRRTRSAGS